MTKRRIIFSDSEVSLAASGDKRTVTGYAMKWNSISSDRGGFFVRLLPGSATFAEPTAALRHHDWKSVLASTVNQTLQILPDDVGVKVVISLPNTTDGNDLAELIGNGTVSGMSFAMLMPVESTETIENGNTIVNVSKFTCDEVTITAAPSFEDATCEIAEDAEEEGDFAALTKQKIELSKLTFSALRLPRAETR